MPIFAHVKQRAEGCDYTLGCGQKFYEVKGATTLASAAVTALQEWADRISESGEDERDLESLTLYDVAEVMPVDLEQVRAKLMAESAARREKIREDSERTTYEHLKGKYG